MLTFEMAKDVVRLQHDLNKFVAGDDYLDKNLDWQMACYDEIAEIMGSIPWQWWKKGNSNLENIKVEAVDIIHFAISWAINREHHRNPYKDTVLDIIAMELEENIKKPKKNNNVLSINEIKQKINNLFKWTVEQEPIKLIQEAVNLFYGVNTTQGENVWRIYITKNVLNKFRREFGYKEGRYNKMWQVGNNKTVEDNEFAMNIAKTIKFDNDFANNLFNALKRKYNSIYGEVY